MAYIHTTWLAGRSATTRVTQGSNTVSVDLIDGISIGAVTGEHAAELGRTLMLLGEQVLVLNGDRRTDQDDLIVKAFLDGEGLGQQSAALFHRFIAYRDSVMAHPYDDAVLNELEAVAS